MFYFLPNNYFLFELRYIREMAKESTGHVQASNRKCGHETPIYFAF